jgi:hypothetical protein
MSPPPKITRRSMTIGGAVAIGAAVVAGGIFEIPKFIKRRARGHYADLVNRLDDPEQAAIVGKAVHMDRPDGTTPSLEDAAASVRLELKARSLPDLLARDVVSGELMEAGGWVLPATLAKLCSMAAQSV